MDTLIFNPAPLRGDLLDPPSCHCRACRQPRLHEQQHELERSQGGTSPPGCGTDELPIEARGEIEACSSKPATRAILCKPGSGVECPPIPKLWTSSTIQGVPFSYLPTVTSVPGTAGKRQQIVSVKDPRYKVRLTPAAWMATHAWITTMRVAGLEIARIYTAGAGPYCRCIKNRGCGEKTPAACTGTTVSNHGYGDALDIVGVKWKNKDQVGSSLQATVIHSWQDSAEQAPILVRINAALRTAFATVIDYSNANHQDHFHCDTNRGRPRPVWQLPAEGLFLIEVLVRLGWLSSRKPATWERARAALKEFATKRNLAVPADAADRGAWRGVVTHLFDCIAIGGPAVCRR